MTLILGKEYCKLDSNGRFKLPIALKKQLQTDDNRFVIRPSIYDECLELWSYSNFEAEIARLRQELHPYSPADRKLLRKLSDGNIIELDNSDRLVIPPEQKQVLKGTNDLVLQSIGELIEIWDSATYQSMNEQDADFVSLVSDRLGNVPPATE